MTKPEIIAKLKELGVKHDPNAHPFSLMALLRKAQAGPQAAPPGPSANPPPAVPPEGIPPGPPTEPPATPPPAPEPPKGATSATVCDPRGNPHRTYSFEIHGKDFRKLAEQYVSDRPGWTVK